MKKLIVFVCCFCVTVAHCAVLHFGDKTITMGMQKITSPSLVTDINGKKFYALMVPNDKCKLCMEYADVKYEIQDNKFLEYLYFDGNSYIDLGFSPTPDLNFEIKSLAGASFNGDVCLLGARDSVFPYTKGQFTVWYRTNLNIMPSFGMVDDEQYSLLVPVDNVPVVVRLENKILYVDGVGYDVQVNDKLTTQNLVLGALRYANIIDYRMFVGRIYRAKFWNSNGVIMDLVPTLDASGVPCMYDTVSKRFLYNGGAGQLKAGDADLS